MTCFFYYRIFPSRKKKKRATSAPPGVDLDAGSTSGSLQLSPTFSWLFTFCSGVAMRHLFLSVVFCLLLAIAPACQSKSCVCYVIRGAHAREMNKHQCGYAGSGKNEADMWGNVEEMQCKWAFSTCFWFIYFYLCCRGTFCLVFRHSRYLKSAITPPDPPTPRPMVNANAQAEKEAWCLAEIQRPGCKSISLDVN